MCAIHDHAVDALLVGVRPDYVVRVGWDVSREHDGPTPRHALQETRGISLWVPRRMIARPSKDLLEERHGRSAQRSNPEDHVLVNRASWDADAPNWIERGRASWSGEPSWGIWGVPEAELGLLPDVEGLDTVELGCGTGYVSAWLARRGAQPVGLDNSGQQLATAKRFQDEFGLWFPLVHADAERLPFRDEVFDFAVSEYGAAIWCDPFRWIPEAARVLRPEGRLLFIAGTPLLMMSFPTHDDAAPAEPNLHRDYFGMHRYEWHDEEKAVDAIEFNLTHGDRIRLLRSSGFEVEDLVEIQAPEQKTAIQEADVPWEWARRWPSVEAWKARKL